MYNTYFLLELVYINGWWTIYEWCQITIIGCTSISLEFVCM